MLASQGEQKRKEKEQAVKAAQSVAGAPGSDLAFGMVVLQECYNGVTMGLQW
jgi:hypothetical protein